MNECRSRAWPSRCQGKHDISGLHRYSATTGVVEIAWCATCFLHPVWHHDRIRSFTTFVQEASHDDSQRSYEFAIRPRDDEELARRRWRCNSRRWSRHPGWCRYRGRRRRRQQHSGLLLSGGPELARTPQLGVLSGGSELARTPQLGKLPGVLGLARNVIAPVLFAMNW